MTFHRGIPKTEGFEGTLGIDGSTFCEVCLGDLFLFHILTPFLGVLFGEGVEHAIVCARLSGLFNSERIVRKFTNVIFLVLCCCMVIKDVGSSTAILDCFLLCCVSS